MTGARRDDDRDDERPADPGADAGVDVDVPDLDLGPAAGAGDEGAMDEPTVDDAPGDQEAG